MSHPSSEDTAVIRMKRSGGFNARVEPLWHSINRLKGRSGWLELWKLKRKTRRIVSRVNRVLSLRGQAVPAWDQGEGGCLCNLRVARVGLIAGLQDCLRKTVAAKYGASWAHLFALRDTATLGLPIDFEEPFTLERISGTEDLRVASIPRLTITLQEINRELRIEETFALAQMNKVDFMDANERDISKFESKFASLDDFWPKFTWVMLKKLVDKSLESGFPIQVP